jgi:hypothetical protein
MHRTATHAAVLSAVSLAAIGLRLDAALAAAAAPGSIAFASRNIFTWQADGEKGIWVQAIGHQWYYGAFMSACTGIQFRDGVGFKFGPAGELDRWGAVLVPHVPECFFKSFTVSTGPPPKKAPAPAAAPDSAKPGGVKS